MFRGSQSSSAYYSGDKRTRDSLQPQSQSSLRPYLMGSTGSRSPTKKRSRRSLGGDKTKTSEVDWSSLLNFHTPLRSSSQRSSALRRRETIHSLPGQLASPALSTPAVRSGVMNASPGFFLRDRSERQSVARALQILDSRKRLRELSNNGLTEPDTVHREPTPVIEENGHRKRRRLTINGTLEEMLQQEDTFASTSLGEIASKAKSQGRIGSGADLTAHFQKRIFTSGISETTGLSAEPSSKRSRQNDGVTLVANGGESLNDSGRSRPGSSTNSNSIDPPRSEAAHHRRLLSYIAPAKVEARYARRSAATDLLSRSHNSSRSATPVVIRRASQVINQVTTTGAQTELSCNQTDVLQKSPGKDGEDKDEKKEVKDTEAVPIKRRAPLSVADFVAHLDRARTTQPSQAEAQRRSATDGQARKERLNRLRKLLSDVTQEPTPPTQPISSKGTPFVTSSNPGALIGGSSVISALLTQSSNSGPPKPPSFGVTSTSAALPTSSGLGLPGSALSTSGGFNFGANQKTATNTISTEKTVAPNVSALIQKPGLPSSLTNVNSNTNKTTGAPVPVTTTQSSIASAAPAIFGIMSSTALGGSLITSTASNSNAGALNTGLPVTRLSTSTSISTPLPSVQQQATVTKGMNVASSNVNVFQIPQEPRTAIQTSVTSAPKLTSAPSFGQPPQASLTGAPPVPLSFGQTPQNSVKTTVPTNSFVFGQPGQTSTSMVPSSTANRSLIFGQPTSTQSVASLATSDNNASIFGQSGLAASAASTKTTNSTFGGFGQPALTTANSTTPSTLPFTSNQTVLSKTNAPSPFGPQPTVPTTSVSFSFGQASQFPVSTTSAATLPKTSQFSFGQSSQTPTSSITSAFSFGQTSQAPSTGNTATMGGTLKFGAQANDSSNKVPVASTAPFSFGAASVVTAASKSDSVIFGQAPVTNSKPASTLFTFGQPSQSEPAPAPAPVSKPLAGNLPLSFGQTEPKPLGIGGGVGGSLFSFTKTSDPVKSTNKDSAPALFPFTSSAASSSQGVNNPTIAAPPTTNAALPNPSNCFTFTSGNQENSRPKPPPTTTAASVGLFSFGQITPASTVGSGLFGAIAKDTASAGPTATTSNAAFSFGSSALTPNSGGPSTTSSTSTAVQPFAFGAVTANGTSSTSNTVSSSSSVFGTSSKPGFSFGQTTAPAVSSGAFSFGSNQPPAKQEQLIGPKSTAPAVNNSNGAGFTFHPPPTNVTPQTGSFSFGGTAPGIGQAAGPPAGAPFAFGGQQPQQSPLPSSGNLFSQTTTSAPRKKISGLLRKRSTRK